MRGTLQDWIIVCEDQLSHRQKFKLQTPFIVKQNKGNFPLQSMSWFIHVFCFCKCATSRQVLKNNIPGCSVLNRRHCHAWAAWCEVLPVLSLPPQRLNCNSWLKSLRKRGTSANKQFQQLRQCENSPAVGIHTLIHSAEGGGGDPKLLCSVSQTLGSGVSGQWLSYNSGDPWGIFEMWLNELKVNCGYTRGWHTSYTSERLADVIFFSPTYM